MKRDELAYLRHILDAIAKTQLYLENVDDKTFYSTSLIQDGVIRQIEIIGEAARHLSPELRQKYPHVPWADISGMRDKLIHGYFGVDLERVWITASDDLPVLREQVQKILDELTGI